MNQFDIVQIIALIWAVIITGLMLLVSAIQ